MLACCSVHGEDRTVQGSVLGGGGGGKNAMRIRYVQSSESSRPDISTVFHWKICDCTQNQNCSRFVKMQISANKNINQCTDAVVIILERDLTRLYK